MLKKENLRGIYQLFCLCSRRPLKVCHNIFFEIFMNFQGFPALFYFFQHAHFFYWHILTSMLTFNNSTILVIDYCRKKCDVIIKSTYILHWPNFSVNQTLAVNPFPNRLGHVIYNERADSTLTW